MNDAIGKTVSTETHWMWTSIAEAKWDKHHVEPRKAGMMLTEINSEGYRSKRIHVPLLWVQKGYVIEADGEQTDLFDYL